MEVRTRTTESLLYSGNYSNINQLYFSETLKMKKKRKFFSKEEKKMGGGLKTVTALTASITKIK